ncbi:MAG: alpha-amylase [Lachnospiraceae bacterium]|nr:alpha-amylase [Lachnospiraceae bacterium]
MSNTKELKYKIKSGNPLQLGAVKTNDGINFALMINSKERKPCSVILYEKGTLKVAAEIAFSEEMWYGNICTMCIQGISLNNFDYNYRVGNKVITDPYAAIINGGAVFGENDVKKKTSSVYVDRFNWGDDRKPMTDFSDSVIYRLHVRGFTMHRFSKVRKKGTFAGITEKIDYLKELGVTMVELMPAYEFNENADMPEGKVNYWGYTSADYFMPKIAYSYKKDGKSAIQEFKSMVKELHKNNIEVCMEFYFDKSISPAYMIDCFRYWVIHYHIDGIHCNMSDDIKGAVSADPYLSRTKIISYGFDNDEYSVNKHLGEANHVFMNIARRFLKGDGGMIREMAFRIRYNKDFATPVNYMANNNTFTMMDMVSYSSKHNEKNGDNNKDGTEDNFSWNCGLEGSTKKKKITEFRLKQLKNAMCMLMLSQGAPMIYAGDEFGNSCDGNNNPYCQDNNISYLDWRLVNKNSELFGFVKMLIQFRKEHNILHLDSQMQLRDYHSLGMPDMSFHSDKTWTLDGDSSGRQLGVMLYGKYCKVFKKNEEENIYIAFNMHWEGKKLGLPIAGKGKEWRIAFATDDIKKIVIDSRKVKFARSIELPPRSVAVLVSEESEEVKKEEQAEQEAKLNKEKKTAEAEEKLKAEKDKAEKRKNKKSSAGRRNVRI